jgi:hypothetical protein
MNIAAAMAKLHLIFIVFTPKKFKNGQDLAFDSIKFAYYQTL